MLFIIVAIIALMLLAPEATQGCLGVTIGLIGIALFFVLVVSAVGLFFGGIYVVGGI